MVKLLKCKNCGDLIGHDLTCHSCGDKVKYHVKGHCGYCQKDVDVLVIRTLAFCSECNGVIGNVIIGNDADLNDIFGNYELINNEEPIGFQNPYSMNPEETVFFGNNFESRLENKIKYNARVYNGVDNIVVVCNPKKERILRKALKKINYRDMRVMNHTTCTASAVYVMFRSKSGWYSKRQIGEE